MTAVPDRPEFVVGSSLAELAAGLQLRLQQEQASWLAAAVDLHVMIDEVLRLGQSLPEKLMVACERLQQGKARLAEEIREAVEPLQLPDWTAPEAAAEFSSFRERLDDLAAICAELDRVTAEKMAGHQLVLGRVLLLAAGSAEAEIPLQSLQRQAAEVREQLQLCCHSVVDREVERLLDVFKAVLLLADDAECRTGGAACERFSGAAVVEAFNCTAGQCGIVLAVELLRGNCRAADESEAVAADESGPEPAADLCEHPSSAGGGVQLDAGEVVSETATELAEVQGVAVQPDAPEPLQLERLLSRFSGQFSLKRVGQVSQATNSANRSVAKMSLRELTPMSESLRKRAGQLSSQGQSVKGVHVGLPLASALRCAALAIDCVGIVQRETGGAGTFTRRDYEITNRLLSESLQQSQLAVEGWAGVAPVVIPELNRISCWLQCNQQPADNSRHSRQSRAAQGDKSESATLMQRIRDYFKDLNQRQRKQRLLESVQEHCKSLSVAESDEQLRQATAELDSCIAELQGLGLSPNDAELRRILLPVYEFLVDATAGSDAAETAADAGVCWSSPMQSVMQHLQHWRERNPVDVPAENCCTEAVAAVRQRLQGKVLAVVGGVCRPHAAERLKREFNLQELRWLNASKADRVDYFQPDLRGAAAVVLITRLMGHKHTRIHDLCQPLGIPCVQTRYSVGYSVNQIAEVILAQASEQLPGGQAEV